MGAMAKIVLASTSRYRRETLSRLGLPFEVYTPDVDEATEGRAVADPYARAAHLADLKALSGARLHDAVTLIGGDQLVVSEGEFFGKPLTAEAAVQQLSALSGRCHEVVTALSVWHRGTLYRHTDVTRLRMRALAPEEIRRYVERDAPFDCAGSYRIETLGIALFDEYETQDPTALSGIPLIALARILRHLGHAIP
jgi:septum formation protein